MDMPIIPRFVIVNIYSHGFTIVRKTLESLSTCSTAYYIPFRYTYGQHTVIFTFIHSSKRLDSGSQHEIFHVHTSRDLKRRISTCSQVCRYWARVCRPHIFSYITLRSSGDVQFFKAVLCRRLLASLPPIATYVKMITAVRGNKD
jgi:hypothetical protein